MEIRYADPRPGLANIGVTQGTLLVKGVRVGNLLGEGQCRSLRQHSVVGAGTGDRLRLQHCWLIPGISHNAYLRFDQVTER